jgi:HTH-type transcriptional regulator, glycine betaine synthesis regulator
MDRVTAIFVDGIGTAAATSGILGQLQGRIFALLYLRSAPVALEEIAAALQQSKSSISVNIRGLVEWHLVRRVAVAGSRKDHYDAATNFWRVMLEVMERRFRWTVRQVLATITETEHAATEREGRVPDTVPREPAPFVAARLTALRLFFAAVDGAIGAFTQGKPVDAESLQNLAPPAAAKGRLRR